MSGLKVDKENPQALLEKSELIYSGDELRKRIFEVANELNGLLGDTTPIALCIMNGGLVFSGHLLPLLKFPLELDYVHATRYQDDLSSGNLSWERTPNRDLQGKTVLLIDDILDEGVTLNSIGDWCLRQGATEIYVVTLCCKQHDRQKTLSVSKYFNAVEVPDQYVFGFGMDCYGWWRNLDGIYALNA